MQDCEKFLEVFFNLSFDLKDLIGLVEVQTDNVLIQAQALLASYPILWAVIGIAIWGIIKKAVKLIVLACVVGAIWLFMRGTLPT